jgi:hypothetical protein
LLYVVTIGEVSGIRKQSDSFRLAKTKKGEPMKVKTNIKAGSAHLSGSGA